MRPAARPEPAAKPLVIDLCCGEGGWADGFLAEGYEVIGFDIDPQPTYPGHFIRGDVRVLPGQWFAGATVIVASPPCDQFSRWQMPWTRRRNPPPPDLSVVEACRRIAREAGVPLILENVGAAQRWLGQAAWHCGSFYLWDDVPALMPEVAYRKKESYTSSRRLARARVPFELASHIARVFKPAAANSAVVISPRPAAATGARTVARRVSA